MNIVNLGTYPPKQCGIATFSNDLRNSLIIHGHRVQAIAISDEDSIYKYPQEVILEMRQQRLSDYATAVNCINQRPDIDLLIIQHEYGIFGGEDGEYIQAMVKQLHKPFILITHTVLPVPSKRQKQILNDLCQRAAGIVCMTRLSAELLIELYEAPPELITVIAHGVPEFKRYPQSRLKSKYGLSGCPVVSTFGLIGPGKGLELGIQAVAELIPRHPEVRYLILGQTHPMLQKSEGERYRQKLTELVDKLQISDNVIFVNKFLSDKELGEYLYMTDIYLSPYPNMDQAVSGTMAFAMGCGRAVVSTPYAYAREALNEGRGLLSDSADPHQLAELVERILNDHGLQKKLQKKALELGEGWTWPNVGKQYNRFFRQILNSAGEESRPLYAEL